MAVAKICGTETEFGIAARGVDLGPMAASTMLVAAYSRLGGSVDWDHASEHPGSDARGFDLADPGPPGDGAHMVSTVLPNGARFYVDHAHPEYSSPECRDAVEAVVWDLAGEEIVRSAMERAAALLPAGAELVAYKNNTDGKGNSYGCHENYLMDRRIPFSRIVSGATPHLVTRQVFCGAGKVGSETGSSVEFQISQRPDFIEEEVGLETTVRRPILNTRDEPHADPTEWRRLHVILGDANMSQTATMLKVGTTAIVLAMIEDGAFPDDLGLEDPVQSNRAIAADPSLTTRVRLTSGGRMSALDVQHRIHDAAQAWARNVGLDAVGGDGAGSRILDAWGSVLDSLGGDQSLALRTVDWLAKRRMIDAHCARHGHAPTSAAARAIDLQYHDLRADRSLALKAGLLAVVDPAAVRRAVDAPPPTTRAFLRGSIIARWPRAVVSCNWDGIVLALDGDRLFRLTMDDPLWGCEAEAAEMLGACSSPEELVRSAEARRRADR